MEVPKRRSYMYFGRWSVAIRQRSIVEKLHQTL